MRDIFRVLLTGAVIALLTGCGNRENASKDDRYTEAVKRNSVYYWKTVFEDYDTSTANGQMVVNIMLAVNQNECDRTSERIKTVFAHKIRNGEHLTGAAPYGYVTVNKKFWRYV